MITNNFVYENKNLYLYKSGHRRGEVYPNIYIYKHVHILILFGGNFLKMTTSLLSIQLSRVTQVIGMSRIFSQVIHKIYTELF